MTFIVSSRGIAALNPFTRLTVAYSRRTLKEIDLIWKFAKSYTCSSVREEFTIRLIETEEEYKSIIINAMVKEGRRPGLRDGECFFACDPTGAFVGELNGRPICCITMTKYGANFAFGGSFMVSKEHRGKGYGRKIYDAALASVKPRSIGILPGLLTEQSEEANKRRGFRSLFYGAHFVFNLPTAIMNFSEASDRSSVKLEHIKEVDQESLLRYDTTVLGFERHAFLSKWLRVTDSFARVAISNKGSIVGYTVARPTFVKEEGYKIGPLFADSETIADKLLKSVFEEILQKEGPNPVVSIDAPSKKASELCERLQGKRLFDMVYMVRGDPPDACFDKWFGYTTTQLG